MINSEITDLHSFMVIKPALMAFLYTAPESLSYCSYCVVGLGEIREWKMLTLLTTCFPHVEQEGQALFPERAFTISGIFYYFLHPLNQWP